MGESNWSPPASEMAEEEADKLLFALMDANKSGDVDGKEFMSFMLFFASGCENDEEKKFVPKFMKTIGEIADKNESESVTWEMWNEFEPPEGRFTDADMALLLKWVTECEANPEVFKEGLQKYRAMTGEESEDCLAEMMQGIDDESP